MVVLTHDVIDGKKVYKAGTEGKVLGSNWRKGQVLLKVKGRAFPFILDWKMVKRV